MKPCPRCDLLIDQGDICIDCARELGHVGSALVAGSRQVMLQGSVANQLPRLAMDFRRRAHTRNWSSQGS